jgi:hypothetical protein
VPSVATTIAFADVAFEITSTPENVTVRTDASNWVTIAPKNQRTHSEAFNTGGLALVEEQRGRVDYFRYFVLSWQEEDEPPELVLQEVPVEVVRQYAQGQVIELGLEDVGRYDVRYRDGVEARFERDGPDAFRFAFTTGLEGSFWRDADGSYTLRFMGERAIGDEDAKRSQSKFIVSRSRYTGNLLLVLQEGARVVIT